MESGPDIRTIAITTENVVRYPLNIGLTGVAIKEGRSMIIDQGEKDHRYKSDIDNLFNREGLRNIMICPFYQDGEIRGVFQLINRIGHDEILEQDLVEANSISPALS